MPSADELRTLGNQAFAEKKYTKAARIYRDAIKLEPSPALYSNRAQCFIYLEDWKRAWADAEAGLQLDCDSKIRVKLLYKRGLIGRSMGYKEEAVSSLNDALRLDPNNKAVIEMLHSLNEPNSKKIKLDNQTPDRIRIPITPVDSLPREFSCLLEPSLSDAHADVKVEAPKVSEKVSSQIDELFPKKSASTAAKAAPATQTSQSFMERSGTHYLKALSRLPPNDKVNAYKLVLEMSPDTYDELFSSSGVDVEYMAFFLEAAVFASNNEPEHWWSKTAFSHLKRLSQFRRYQLALDFCSQAHITTLLQNVVKLNKPDLLSQFETVLGRN